MAERNGAPQLIEDLRKRLNGAAGPEGGWSYYRGQGSRLEPTAWALIALSATDHTFAETHRAAFPLFLARLSQTDHLLADTGSAVPNYAWNGLTLLALTALQVSAATPVFARIQSALLKAKGIQLTSADPAVMRQNNQLQAWSWIAGTFSWAEPTAWCLLALKKASARIGDAATRIADAEAVLIDRVCHPGGWNYGNSAVFTQDLRPYVPTSALALLAMQDRRDHPAVANSLTWLEMNATTERSAMALGLAAICLYVFNRPVDAVLAALVEQDTRTKFLGNAHLAAMALYALTIREHRARAFTV
jgi:hypothetical protein